MDLGLKGKNAAITGSSQGIGNAIANSLADEGCNVALSARNEARLNQAVSELETKGVKAIGVQHRSPHFLGQAVQGAGDHAADVVGENVETAEPGNCLFNEILATFVGRQVTDGSSMFPA